MVCDKDWNQCSSVSNNIKTKRFLYQLKMPKHESMHFQNKFLDFVYLLPYKFLQLLNYFVFNEAPTYNIFVARIFIKKCSSF